MLPYGPDETLARTQQDLFWVPDDVTVLDQPELLVLSCPRDLVGLNAVQRSRGPADAMPGLVDRVRVLHAGRRSRWAVCPLEPVRPLEQALAAGGYTLGDVHHGFSLDSAAFEGRTRPGVVARRVTDMAGLDDWLTVSGLAFASPRASTDTERQHYLDTCVAPDARVMRVVAYDSETGQPLSAGGLTLFPDLRFGFMWAGGTVPEGRGRGAYGAVLAARAAHAHGLGIERIGLYACDQTSAPIVASLGFERHGRMAFWEHAA